VNPLVVETPEIPEVLDLELGTYRTLSDVVGIDYDAAMQTRHRIKDAQCSGQVISDTTIGSFSAMVRS
jgi:hypothetical protein